MKILRIFGVVVGVHVFALMLIFANPGCSSTNKPPPPSAENAGSGDDGFATSTSSGAGTIEPSPISADPAYNPTSATSGGGSAGVRFSPTRPNTPAAGALDAAPVSDVTPASTYTVVPGDSLWTIARRNQISVGELAAANNIRESAVVRIGQRLIIPVKAQPSSSMSVMDSGAASAAKAAPAAPATPRAQRQTVKHVVKSGETLGGIARKYQVRVGDIATANNIADPAKIRPGMELTIPGWQAPAGRSAATSTPATRAAAAPATTAPAETPRPAAESAWTQPSDADVPTLVLPPPDEETSEEPPVIRVDEAP